MRRVPRDVTTAWLHFMLDLYEDTSVALSAEGGVVRLWDARTGAEAARLEGHTSRVTALAVLPDGRLASGSDDRTIRPWDLKIGKELCRLEIDAGVLCLAAHFDGRLVAGDTIGRLHWLEIVDRR